MARSTSTTATTTAITSTARPRKRNASSSDRSGPHTWSEEVDRRVDDHPHHVDEVPVDARHLDAAVLLGGEVPLERPRGDHREKREPDEDVRAVEAGEPIEDRHLRGVVGRDPEVDVLVDLDEEEGRAEQERRDHAG